MTEKVKQMAPLIWEEIEKAQNILLHCHPSPDSDSIGGALALYHILKKINKNPTIISGDNPTPLFLQHLPGANQIIQKSFFEIDVSEFDLFLILDSSSKNQVSKKGEVVFPESLKTVVIDHHTNFGYANINLIDTSYPATCQIIYELVKEWNLEIPAQVAACLYVGLYGDSGGFKYPPTNWSTLLAASETAKIFPDFSSLIFKIENSVDPDQIKFMGITLNHIEHYFGSKVAIAVASFEELQQHNINSQNIIKGDIANTLKSVIGWDIGVCCTQVSPEQVEYNFRTRDSEKFDVGEIARRMGGGGHRAAAGAPVKKPLKEAQQVLLNVIKELYPGLGNP